MVRLLIIDDNKSFTDAMQIVMPHETIIAANGREGLDALARHPDIIFLDYNMPVMNGYEFSKQLRQNPEYSEYSKMPLIGIGDFPDNRKGFLDDSLQKPVKYTVMLEYVKKYCRLTAK